MMDQAEAQRHPIRILLVDDHAVMRAGLGMLIQSQASMQVVGEAGNKAEAIALAAREQPDIILLDLILGRENAVDFVPELLSAAAETRVIVLTGMTNTEEHQRAVRLGAMGVLLKESSPQLLLKAIDRVHAGEVWLDRFLTASLIVELRGSAKPAKPQPEEDPIAKLTNREREVIALVGEGLKNKQIAGRLFISENTVRHHLASIFEKVKVSDRIELLILAYKKGLVTLPK
jgi:two-component system nitrate/nitrite response regulator NarL